MPVATSTSAWPLTEVYRLTAVASPDRQHRPPSGDDQIDVGIEARSQRRSGFGGACVRGLPRSTRDVSRDLGESVDHAARRTESLRLDGAEGAGIRRRVEDGRPRQFGQIVVAPRPVRHHLLPREYAVLRTRHNGMLTAHTGPGRAWHAAVVDGTMVRRHRRGRVETTRPSRLSRAVPAGDHGCQRRLVRNQEPVARLPGERCHGQRRRGRHRCSSAATSTSHPRRRVVYAIGALSTSRTLEGNRETFGRALSAVGPSNGEDFDAGLALNECSSNSSPMGNRGARGQHRPENQLMSADVAGWSMRLAPLQITTVVPRSEHAFRARHHLRRPDQGHPGAGELASLCGFFAR